MSDDEILLRACDIWMKRELARQKAALEWERSSEQFSAYFPDDIDIDALAEKLLDEDSIVYVWLKCERKKILEKVNAT